MTEHTDDHDLQSWVGRIEECEDNVDAGHIERVALALDAPVPEAGDALPPLWHWALFVKGYPYSGLGADGHPARGGFLPPADDRNRMWAGGRVRFLVPLLVGSPALRRSTIQEVTEKQGRTGKLLFVTVLHEYYQGHVLCISEEQDIVYREPTPPRLEGSVEAPEAQWSETIHPDATMLFRYSAVTFNGHRIHYDQDYVTREEGYPGLVVHGPLIATRMCQAFINAHDDKTIAAFSYRGLRPLIAPRPFQVAGMLDGTAQTDNHQEQGVARLWAEQDGTLAHQAELRFIP